jgi:hypothetical protein
MSVTDNAMETTNQPPQQNHDGVGTTNAYGTVNPVPSSSTTTDIKINGGASQNGVVDAEAAASTTGCSNKDNDEVVDDDDDGQESVKSEGAEEEDALFTNLEMEEEQEEAAHPHEQPSDARAAPKLLQSALAKGDVAMDDSEHASAAAAADQLKTAKDEEAGSLDHHIHQRVRMVFPSLSLFLCFVEGTIIIC